MDISNNYNFRNVSELFQLDSMPKNWEDLYDILEKKGVFNNAYYLFNLSHMPENWEELYDMLQKKSPFQNNWDSKTIERLELPVELPLELEANQPEKVAPLETHAVLPGQKMAVDIPVENKVEAFKKREKIVRTGQTVVQVAADQSISSPNFIKMVKTAHDSRCNEILDQSGTAECLDNLNNAGSRHLNKRIELFNVVCRYLDENKTFINKDYFIDNSVAKGEFSARAYVIPNNLSPKSKTEFQRAHISLINKLVFKKSENGEYYFLKDQLFYKSNPTDLINLLNTCDYTFALVNQIDSEMESLLRTKAKVIFKKILVENLSPEKAVGEMKKEYKIALNSLSQMINDHKSKGYEPKASQAKNEFERNRINNQILILRNNSASKVVNDMLTAL